MGRSRHSRDPLRRKKLGTFLLFLSGKVKERTKVDMIIFGLRNQVDNFSLRWEST